MRIAILLLIALCACSHGKPSKDSIYWTGCKAYCIEQNQGEAIAVIENATDVICKCDKPPGPTT